MLNNTDFKKYTLHIIQTKKHAKHYIKKFRNKKNNIAFPISVESLYLLEENNLKFLTFADLWDSSAELHYKNLYTKNINDFIKELDLKLIEISSDFIFIAEAFRFQLEIILGNLFFLYQFKNEILDLKFKKVICYQSLTLSNFIYEFRPNPRKIIFNIFYNNSMPKLVQNNSFIPDLYILKEEIINILKTNIWKYLRKFLKKSRGIDKVNINSYLLVGGEYEWPLYLSNRKILFSRINRNYKFNLKNNNNILFRGVLNDLFKKYFYFNKFFYKSFLNKFINKIALEISYIISRKDYCNYLLSTKKTILTSCVVDPFEAYLCLLFKSRKKEVILWQHGEEGIISDRDILTESAELRICSKYLSYSNNVSRALKKNFNLFLNPKNTPEFYTVGSVHKNINYQFESNSNNLVLLCAGKFFGISRFFQDFADPDLRLYKIHKSFLKIAKANYKDYKFLIKANNTFMFNHLPYKLNKSFGIDYKSKFIKLLTSSKVVILDTPATTLLEASSTDVPIFAIKGRNNYTKEFIEISSKRVCWCEDNIDLEYKIQEFLSKGNYEADIGDKSLLNCYLGDNDREDIWNKVDNILKS